MHRTLKHFAVAALLASTLSGCSDFLSGPTVDEDPNNPTIDAASEDNLFVGFQATQFSNFASTMVYTICGYVQHCEGFNNRFLEVQMEQYESDPATFDLESIQVYGTGGLGDLKRVRAKLEARSIRDPLYEGIVNVWEALIVSEAADKWGDIPYSEAGVEGISQPVLDDQIGIYNSLLALLDQAITQINDPTGVGPGDADLSLGSSAAAWAAVAHTLKARILLHTVRAQCATLPGCPVYAQIVNELVPGGTPVGLPVDGSLDLAVVTAGDGALTSNGWFQFYDQSGFGPDMRAGTFLVNLMNDRVQAAGGAQQDPRFTTYFAVPTDCGISTSLAQLVIARSCLPSGAAFPQPWVTGEESALILAEAYFNTGNAAAAQAQLDAVKAKYSVPVEPVSLEEIIEEKYVSLFQNPEVWNDYKRTCLPALTPTSNEGPNPGLIPRRAFYGQTEQDSNGNIPDASTQLGSGTPNQPGFRNDNDPAANGCTPLSI
jgi:hypothetical protein